MFYKYYVIQSHENIEYKVGFTCLSEAFEYLLKEVKHAPTSATVIDLVNGHTGEVLLSRTNPLNFYVSPELLSFMLCLSKKERRV